LQEKKQSIKPSLKIISLLVGSLILCLHFGLVLLQHASFLSDKHKLFYIVRGYESFFHQSWNLFVPPPNTNYKLFVTFENNGIQKKDIFSEVLLQHQSNRLKGYEPLVVAFSNCIYCFEKSTALQAPINGPVKNDVNFTMIELAVKSYIEHTYKTHLQKPRLILLTQEAGTKKQKVYFN
jgi:hypothetical protein